METFNLFSGETDMGPTEKVPPGYQSRAATLGPKLGASRLGMSVYDLPPGQASCPYHFEWTDEEWLIALAGQPTIRTPEGERVLDPGDVVCFPAGPGGAHQVRNASQEPARVAIFSTKNEFGIAEYPDSDKVGIWADETHYMLRRSPHLKYWDNEHGEQPHREQPTERVPVPPQPSHIPAEGEQPPEGEQPLPDSPAEPQPVSEPEPEPEPEPAPAEGEQALPDAPAEPKPVSEPEAAAAEGEQPLPDDAPAQPESESGPPQAEGEQGLHDAPAEPASEPAPAEGDEPLPDDAPAEPETAAPDGPRNSVR